MPTRIETFMAERNAAEVRVRKAHPVVGWHLPFLARLDREGARGLLADLTLAGSLTRQAAYIVAACLDLDDTDAFLTRLGIDTAGAEGIGLALRTRHAKDLIAAVFSVAPSGVPTGFLRALVRIQEVGSSKPGLDAFKDQDSYATLFRIFTQERHSRKAHALRFCGNIGSSSIEAVETLDAVLVWPEVVQAMGTPRQVSAANALLGFIRSAVSTQSDEEMVVAMRRSLGSRNILAVFAQKVLEKADRLAPPPYPAEDGLRALTTAAELQEFGQRMSNCAATKLAEIAMGLLSIYEVRHTAEDGKEHVLAASLEPLMNGTWMVKELKAAKNSQPPADVRRVVLRRLQDLGAVIAGPPLDSPFRSDLAELLGAYRWASLDDCLRTTDPDIEDPIEELEAALDAA